ncbi:MAG: serine hydrolase domain-containing protein [Thermodesulfobacteriota bacterium]|nr:serine hydrolase domain-containing protein [Thermodesulfobacteriota bacterium]
MRRVMDQRYRVLACIILCSLSLLAAGCDGSHSSNSVQEGLFVDNAVEGLFYQTASMSGRTDANGTFQYHRGNQFISFYLGPPADEGVFLGTGLIQAEMSPLDLVPDSEAEKGILNNEVTNISRLLQTLDVDGDLNNNISITSDMETVLQGHTIAFDLDMAAFSAHVQPLIDELNDNAVFTDTSPRALKTAAQARSHLRESLSLVLDPDVSQQLEEMMEETIAEYGWPGAAMGVRLSDGSAWFGTTGVADLETETAVDITDKFRIGSVTKTFTATVVLQLAQEGVLGLDDSIEAWLPGLVPNGENITIRQLMNHTSGLFNYWHLGDPTYMEALEDLLRVWAPRELVEIVAEHDPYFEPGEGWEYSNIGPILEAMIVEKVTGATIESQITDRVIRPLGLDHTSMPGDETITPPHAYGYLDLNFNGVYDAVDDDISFFDTSFAWASGAIITSIEDLLRWCTALTAGEMINDTYQAQRLDFYEISEDLGSGLGIFNEHGALGHKGDIFGYQATVQRYGGVDIAVVVNGQGLVGVDPPEGTGNVAQIIFWNSLPILGLTEPETP